MSYRITRRTRVRAIAAATAVAVSLMVAGPAIAGQVNLDGLQTADTHDQFIVRYRDGSAERASVANARAALQRAARAGVGGKAVALGHERRLAIGADVVRVDRRLDPAEAEALMRQIAADPNVEYVEVDAVMMPLLSPNDTNYSSQWHYFESTGGIRLPTAWDKASGSGVVVAVLDTGRTAHSDLDNNTVAGYDFISDSTNARDGNGRDSNPQDEGDWTSANECGYTHPARNSSWHGTHVAGTVAAVTNNSKGVAGVAFSSKVQHVRVLGKCGGSTSDIADAIVWASGGSVTGVPANATPAEVINMSLGGKSTCSSTYQNAINAAVNKGSVVVVAAGNSNDDVANYTPASCNNVIAVAANDREGNRASYSNYGTKIDVTAPGGETGSSTSNGVLSTLNSGSTTPGSESYAYYQGTSMAAPHVAGVVAMMQSVSPKSPADVESILKNTARALPGTCSGGCGAGIIDANAAIDAVSGGGGGTLTEAQTVSSLSASTGQWIHYTMSVPANAKNLLFKISGGTGDADLYVKYGSQPTDTSYDCRPYKAGNEESCSFATPSSGTWYVSLKAYSSFSGVSLLGDFDVTYTNGTNYTISDNSTVESPISISGRNGAASASSKVSVDIKHTYRGDLVIDLVAPDGSAYRLKDSSGSDSADNVLATYTVNLSAEAINGTWKLRVRDVYSGDTGYIDSWSLTL